MTDSEDTIADGLSQFVPPVLIQRPEFGGQPEHDVATLFIDVAGFTSLSESLASLGPEGAEVLERTIARYFDALMDVIDQFEGLPIKVSGDAITVIFLKRDESLREPLLRALACAADLRSAGLEASQVVTPNGHFALAHKIGVGGGRLISGSVGDPRLRAEFVFAGAALDRAVAAEHHASPGQVWVAPEVVAWVEAEELWAQTDAQGFRRLAEQPSARLRAVSAATSSRRGSLPDAGAIHNPADAHATQSGALPGAEQPPEAMLEPAFRPAPSPLDITRYLSLIPAAVREHAGQGTLKYLCRHQNLTVLFAGCPDMVLDSPESLQQLDAHYRQMQLLIEQYGGFLSEFEAGDKGAKLIVLFGAPTTLEDPCGQAVRCAQAMQQAAREQGLVGDQRIGLSTGRLYVGRIGCRSLAKYSALGDRMNLAARLMSSAERWTVLAERYTVERAKHSIRWGVARTLKVKGKEEPITIFPLLVHKQRVQERRGRGLIGRSQERQVILRAFDALPRGIGGMLQICGAAGSGKTRLVGVLCRMAEDRNWKRILQWNGSLIARQSEPLGPMRTLLLDLIDATDRTPPAELRRKFQTWRSGLPASVQSSAALLASVLGVSWPLDPVIAQLPPDRLLTLRIRGLMDCLIHSAHGEPRILVFDNADRLDSATLLALTEMAPLLHELSLLVVLAYRTAVADQPNLFVALDKAANVQRLEIKELTAHETHRMGALRLKAQRLDPELQTFLMSRAQGNPFLVEAWIDVLRDHGSIRVLENVAYLEAGKATMTLPDRLEALILTQLERLSPEAQLTVRVASVVGQSLCSDEVTALHPEGVSHQVISTHLRLAGQADLLWYDRANPPRMFFSRPEVLAAIHDSMPFHLRRTLHARRVQQLLAELPGEPDGDTTLALAQHHEYIEDLEAQRYYFTRALKVCARRNDYQGAARWARRAIALADRPGGPSAFLEIVSDFEQALVMLGETGERRLLIERWVTEAERADDVRNLVSALNARARIRQHGGDTEGACADLDRTLNLARARDDRQLLIDSLGCANHVHGEGGRNQLALEAADEALRWAPENDASRLFMIYFSRGFALNQLNRTGEAYLDFLQAMKLAEVAAEVFQKAILMGNIGVALWGMGHPEEGHTSLVKALELKRQVSDRKEIGMGLLNVGYSFYRLGDPQKGRNYTDDARRELARVGFYRGELVALGNLGEIQWVAGALVEASQYFDQAERLLARYPHRPQQIELWLRQAELSLTLQEWTRAQETFQLALDASRAAGADGFECSALEGLAEVRRRVLDLDQAQELSAAALAKLEADPLAVAFPQRTWWRAGLIAAATGQSEKARQLGQKAVELVEHERSLLRSFAARNRLVRAFPWNREIVARRGLPSPLP